jgi:heterodisulfide reductase subunit B
MMQNVQVKLRARTATRKAAFKRIKMKKEDSFHQETGTNLRKKLVTCYIISMALNDPKTWTLRKVIKNNLKVFKCGAGEG